MCVNVKRTGRFLSVLSPMFFVVFYLLCKFLSLSFSIFLFLLLSLSGKLEQFFICSFCPSSLPRSHCPSFFSFQLSFSPFHSYSLFCRLCHLAILLTFTSFIETMFFYASLSLSFSLLSLFSPFSLLLHKTKLLWFSSFILIPLAGPCPHPLSCWSSDGIDRRVARLLIAAPNK